jgi:hypothetical protein
MALLLVEYQTSDISGWLRMFESDPMNRAGHGVTRSWIHQDAGDTGTVVLAMEFASAEAAADFRRVLEPVWEISGAQRAWVLREAGSDRPHAGPAEERSYFLYKLIPPRPSFPVDMSEDEAAIMGRHVEYWTEQIAAGHALFFGPVADPAGAWGFAVAIADTEDEVRAMSKDDPAVTTGLSTFEVYAIPGAVTDR